MVEKARQLIELLRLKPHPEGGYFRETYRSNAVADPGADFEGTRSWCTGIYFLLTSENFSSLHRIKQDELWHFYDGDPLHVHSIAPDGTYTRTSIGRDIEAGEVMQYAVPAGHWFGASVAVEKGFSLVGCTVSPGFDFRDFELADREKMTGVFPQHAAIIERLTRER